MVIVEILLFLESCVWTAVDAPLLPYSNDPQSTAVVEHDVPSPNDDGCDSMIVSNLLPPPLYDGANSMTVVDRS